MIEPIASYGLPEQECRPANEFFRKLHDLERYCERFSHAIDLFEFAGGSLERAAQQRPRGCAFPVGVRDQMNRYGSWRFCAAEWAAMQLFHFGKVLEVLMGIKGYQNLKVASSYVSKTSTKAVTSLFEKAFPRHQDVRHAAGHLAEFAMKWEKHAVRTPLNTPEIVSQGNGPIMVNGILVDNVYKSSVDGELLELPITRASALALQDVLAKADAVFNDLRSALAALPVRETLKPREQP